MGKAFPLLEVGIVARIARGGSIAVGHPIGPTGARMITDLVHELHRSGTRYGLLTICEGGGMANATIVECL